MINYGFTVFLGFFIIFFATTLGSALVFFFKGEVSDRLNAFLFGFAGGIMLAASVWSLLIPAIESSESFGAFSFLPACVGFLLGGVFLWGIDRLSLRLNKDTLSKNGENAEYLRPFKTFLAITIHNIPEGLAVGLAFGGALALGTGEAYFTALGLSIGIAVQNFPEGAAVSLPFKRTTGSTFKAFLFGTASGAVEPIAALLGLLLSGIVAIMQPWLLSFAAGAMVYVVAKELIPETIETGETATGTWGLMLGFALMMTLDVALG